MGHPVGPLLATLAGRILDNLDIIDRMAPVSGTPFRSLEIRRASTL